MRRRAVRISFWSTQGKDMAGLEPCGRLRRLEDSVRAWEAGVRVREVEATGWWGCSARSVEAGEAAGRLACALLARLLEVAWGKRRACLASWRSEGCIAGWWKGVVVARGSSALSKPHIAKSRLRTVCGACSPTGDEKS